MPSSPPGRIARKCAQFLRPSRLRAKMTHIKPLTTLQTLQRLDAEKAWKSKCKNHPEIQLGFRTWIGGTWISALGFRRYSCTAGCSASAYQYTKPADPPRPPAPRPARCRLARQGQIPGPLTVRQGQIPESGFPALVGERRTPAASIDATLVRAPESAPQRPAGYLPRPPAAAAADDAADD